jgi:pimeloyl-ACP methyl ester carboxylesterase
MPEQSIRQRDVELTGGWRLHVYDTASDDTDTRLPVFWFHGTPNIGEPPAPLIPAAAQRGIRWISYDRPGYGGSTPRPGRDIAAAASDVSAIAAALSIGRFAVIGHSGGGPHALACGALLPEHTVAVVCLSGPAPIQADGLDWLAGMWHTGAARLNAAAAGRAAFEDYLSTAEFDWEEFTPEDRAALEGDWSWLGGVAERAVQGGPEGMIEDELAGASSWGFEPADVRAPVLFVYGGRDRMVPSSHGRWLARRVRSSELWVQPDDGHITVLRSAEAALDWLVARATEGRTGPS